MVLLSLFEVKFAPLKKRLILGMLVLSLLSRHGLCHQDTLYIQPGFSEVEANPYFSYFNAPTEITADSAWHVFLAAPKFLKASTPANFGSINGYFWFRLHLKNISGNPQTLYLEITQPHIYRIQYYSLENNTISLQAKTGIKYDFYTRPLHYRFYDFPISLKPGEARTVLMMVQHLNSLSLPMNILTQASMNASNYNQNLVWGYWLGFLSFCSLFAFVASILLRKAVFFWYFLYILSAAAYGFTDQGFSFQYIFPGQKDTAALVIIQLAVFNFIFLIKFSQGLLEIKKHLPRVFLLLNLIFYFLLVLLVAGVVLDELMFRLSPIVLPIVNIVTLVGLALLAFSGIKALSTNRIIAIFYLIAYLTLVASAIFTILYSGFGVFEYVGPNPILFSYFLEAILLSVALVILFKQVNTDRTVLMEKLNTQQREMYQHYIDGIEKERTRIAGELHDDVGSRLSYLKQLLQRHSEQSSKTADQVDLLIRDVRQLSHDLSPPMAHVSGLVPLIEKLITNTRLATGLDIKFQQHNYKEILNGNQVYQLYRILQESLNNVIKHAKATRVDVQLFGHEKEVSLTIEDNGNGFSSSEMQDGIGLIGIGVYIAIK